MKITQSFFAILLFVISLGMLPQGVMAQTSIGASYEIRDEEPKNGFGLRLEREILQKLPVIDLALRGHFSYFNDDISYDNRTYSTDVTSYDYGLAAVGGVSIGLLSPYVGLGLGASTLDVSRNDLGGISRPEESSDSAVYWNGFVGAKVSPIPFVKPFIEYRLEDVADYEDELQDVKNSSGRLIFGVSISF